MAEHEHLKDVANSVHEYKVGDRVRTRNGAHFQGTVVSAYLDLYHVPHVDVQATDHAFRGTIHVYPAARVTYLEE